MHKKPMDDHSEASRPGICGVGEVRKGDGHGRLERVTARLTHRSASAWDGPKPRLRCFRSVCAKVSVGSAHLSALHGLDKPVESRENRVSRSK